jgi:hypothetical protein
MYTGCVQEGGRTVWMMLEGLVQDVVVVEFVEVAIFHPAVGCN